jgi:protein XRP2
MGCGSSQSETKSSIKVKVNNPTPHAFGKRTDLDPKDFIFKDKIAEFLVREPGQIEGQQFIIEDCNESDIFLLDHIGSLTIDNCNKCRIVCGPISGSVFIRNCRDCNIIMACQQLRLRDCSKLGIILHSFQIYHI